MAFLNDARSDCNILISALFQFSLMQPTLFTHILFYFLFCNTRYSHPTKQGEFCMPLWVLKFYRLFVHSILDNLSVWLKTWNKLFAKQLNQRNEQAQICLFFDILTSAGSFANTSEQALFWLLVLANSYTPNDWMRMLARSCSLCWWIIKRLKSSHFQ